MSLLLTNDKEDVVIKIISIFSEKYVRERALAEARLMQICKHPNIVAIKRAFECTTHVVLVLEYCNGGDLCDYINHYGALREDEARVLFRQLVSALAHMHRLGVAHRDVKLDNIFLTADRNGALSVKLGDFGFAAEMKGSFTHPMGTIEYAAPELLVHKGDPVSYNGQAVDVYSAGIVLYGMLAGRLPFSGRDHRRLIELIKSGKYHPPASVSSEARELIASMMSLQSAARPTFAAVLASPWLQNQGGRRSSSFSSLPLKKSHKEELLFDDEYVEQKTRREEFLGQHLEESAHTPLLIHT